MPEAKRPDLTRGDLRRNARLARLRAVVRPERAILGIDLASAKQAAVLADHESTTLAKAMFSGTPWVIDEILDWALPLAERAGFAGLVVACEPTGHREAVARALPRTGDRARLREPDARRPRPRGRGLHEEPRRLLRRHLDRPPRGSGAATSPTSPRASGVVFDISGFAATSSSCRRPPHARDCVTCSSATGQHSWRQPRSPWSRPRCAPSLGLDRSPGDRCDGRGGLRRRRVGGASPLGCTAVQPARASRGLCRRFCPGRGDERGASRRRAGGLRPVGLAPSPLRPPRRRGAHGRGHGGARSL